MHQYLCDYADHFKVREHIRLDVRVEHAECLGSDGWRITTRDRSLQKDSMILAKKLVIATGLTSKPSVPQFRGREHYEGLFMHAKDMAAQDSQLIKARSIVVLGGGKSSYDACYSYASRGIKVHMIVRESGYGPVLVAQPYATPFKIWLEKLVFTRFLTWLNPCSWSTSDGFSLVQHLFHGTIIGRFLVFLFWAILRDDAWSLNRYDEHPETRKLKPRTSPFWIGNTLSIMNYPTDFFDLVRTGQIQVHVSDVSHLSPHNVHLASGEAIRADAIVCCTGWESQPSITFLPKGIEESLGLPCNLPPGEADAELCRRADAEILKRFPMLLAQPVANVASTSSAGTSRMQPHRPWRLFRFIVPPAFATTRTVAFAGELGVLSKTMVAQTQAIWIAAFLEGDLDLAQLVEKRCKDTLGGTSMESKVQWDTMVNTQFCKWKSPAGYGSRFPDLAFETLPYVDLLLGDLGLLVQRKGGLLKECFRPYGPEDYKGLIAEYVGLRKKDL